MAVVYHLNFLIVLYRTKIILMITFALYFRRHGILFIEKELNFTGYWLVFKMQLCNKYYFEIL